MSASPFKGYQQTDNRSQYVTKGHFVPLIKCSKDMYFSNLIVYSIFFTNMMTTRTMYKIFKNEYGFETYVPDELL